MHQEVSSLIVLVASQDSFFELDKMAKLSIIVSYLFLSFLGEQEGYTYFAEELYNGLHFKAHLKSRIIVDMDYMIAVYAFEEGCWDYFALMPITTEAMIIYSFSLTIV